ncbi:MAG: L-aspartate oxidase [Flavobacteriales bacterium]|nr:L-aspartate oxidase [Flavobacteriales bacterium]
MKKRLDVIVVGSGIAGMTYATQLVDRMGADAVRVRMLSKAPVEVSNSFAAQGGVAAVIRSDDSFEQHVRDTLTVGAGRNDPKVVRLVVGEGPSLIHGLIGIGAHFDADAKGHLQLAREGGHSTARVVHRRDFTGAEIVRVLRDRVRSSPAIQVLDDQRAMDLLTAGDGETRRCIGVRSLDLRNGDVVDLFAAAVVVATGGAGQVYQHNTNPIGATGDGVAMAIRAGVPLRDMAFVQFHPTALYTEATGQAFLISEAVRGAGARLIRLDGRPLMKGVHPMDDLAPRNIVARAIQRELMRSGSPHVWLDASSIGSLRFAQEFPSIDRQCRRLGIVPCQDLIPVTPAAHYLCGGIRTDDRGRTALAGLFALGECASSGMHGADRLASNSLLEALVIPKRAAEAALAWSAPPAAPQAVVASNKGSTRSHITIARCLATLRHAMSAHAGIVRGPEGLKQVLRVLARLDRLIGPTWARGRWSVDLIDLRDMLAVARAIVTSALSEPVSAGAHYWEEQDDQLPVPKRRGSKGPSTTEMEHT